MRRRRKGAEPHAEHALPGVAGHPEKSVQHRSGPRIGGRAHIHAGAAQDVSAVAVGVRTRRGQRQRAVFRRRTAPLDEAWRFARYRAIARQIRAKPDCP